jgi:hypothetical protein
MMSQAPPEIETTPSLPADSGPVRASSAAVTASSPAMDADEPRLPQRGVDEAVVADEGAPCA